MTSAQTKRLGGIVALLLGRLSPGFEYFACVNAGIAVAPTLSPESPRHGVRRTPSLAPMSTMRLAPIAALSAVRRQAGDAAVGPT